MTDPTDTAAQRMRDALKDPSSVFSRDQLVWFIQIAMRLGHENGHALGLEQGERIGREAVAELNLAAISHPSVHAPFSERELRMEEFRRRARREYDIASAFPWRDDHPGGPIPLAEDGSWIDEPATPAPPAPNVSTRVVRRGGQLVWADE